MEKVVRSLIIDGGYKAEVITKGNFSRVIVSFPSHPDRFFVLSLFLLDLFSEFENQLNLRILNWEILDDDSRRGLEGRPILVHHEPRGEAATTLEVSAKLEFPAPPVPPEEPEITSGLINYRVPETTAG